MRAVVIEADGVLLEVRTSTDNEIPKAAAVADAGELLAILRRLGIKVAVLASPDAAKHLEDTPWRKHIHTVVVSDVRSIDPEKRGLAEAIRAVEAEPQHTAIVSSRVLDVLTGKEGRLAKTVGVSYGGGNREALSVAGADHIINDIPSLLDVLE